MTSDTLPFKTMLEHFLQAQTWQEEAVALEEIRERVPEPELLDPKQVEDHWGTMNAADVIINIYQDYEISEPRLVPKFIQLRLKDWLCVCNLKDDEIWPTAARGFTRADALIRMELP